MLHQAVPDQICSKNLADEEAREAKSAEVWVHFDLITGREGYLTGVLTYLEKMNPKGDQDQIET